MIVVSSATGSLAMQLHITLDHLIASYSSSPSTWFGAWLSAAMVGACSSCKFSFESTLPMMNGCQS